MRDKIVTHLCLGLVLAALSLPARAQEGGEAAAPGNEPEAASADAIAKELSNPAGSLASLKNNFEYRLYEGDLPDARDQDGWTYSFQPVLPFPVGDQGRRIIFRPLIPVKLDEPSGFDPLDSRFEAKGRGRSELGSDDPGSASGPGSGARHAAPDLEQCVVRRMKMTTDTPAGTATPDMLEKLVE